MSTPDAGSLSPNTKTVFKGKATLEARIVTVPVVPTGFSVVNVLTSGLNQVILGTNPRDPTRNPSFDVDSSGDYRIHTLVYDATAVTLNIVFGVTTADDVLQQITAAGSVGALDKAGACFCVNELSVRSPCHSIANYHTRGSYHPCNWHIYDERCRPSVYCRARPCP